jgi:hypothetical protein
VIKELKRDYALGQIPTRRLNANACYFEILRLAYTLVVGFQTLCLPQSWQHATLSTIRANFFMVPAVLVRPHGYPILRMPGFLPIRSDLEALIKKLDSLRGSQLW